MFRLWGKEFKDNHLIRDTVICYEDDPNITRTARIFRAVTQICMEFDLAEPLWLPANIKEFQRRDRTRFTQDNFIEGIDFDYLEIHIIEE